MGLGHTNGEPYRVRWAGALWCRADGCDTVLAEIMVDPDNKTYLQPIGGRRAYHHIITCPKCGRERKFDSVDAGPAPSPAVLLMPKVAV